MGRALVVCLVALACRAPESTYRYREPIVFQRKELDEKTHEVRLNGKLWVMEPDGSHLRQLTFGNTIDEHPTVYEDGVHVLFTEIANNTWFDASGESMQPTKVVKLNMYTGAREVVLEAPDCTYDHAILSAKDTLIYARVCGAAPRIGPNDARREVRIGIGPTSTSPFAARVKQLAGQKPIIASEWQGAPPVEDPCSVMGGHHAAAPDGTIFFECKAKNHRAVIAFVRPNESAKVLYDNGRWNHHISLSHDGRRVLWSSDGPPEDKTTTGAIMMANADGSHVEKLYDTSRSHPMFTRDGKYVLFDAALTGQAEMWRLDLATRKLEQLTHSGKRYSSGPLPPKK